MAVGSKAPHNNMKFQSQADTHANNKERFQCPRCDKHFGHQQILQLHLKVHESNAETPVKSSQQENNERLQPSPPSKKFVGLTKIRMEDCMRCDACSCIYLDESDYKKHMKNFHRQDPHKKHRQKKGCRSCCRHCNCRGNHQHQSVQTDRGNNNLFHYNIKDRWSKMVSRRLMPEENEQDIKADPDYDSSDPSSIIDYSHLLSQVEVKIKTEPPDDPEYQQHM